MSTSSGSNTSDSTTKEIANIFLDFVKNLSIVAGIYLFTKENLDVPNLPYYLNIAIPVFIATTTVVCGIILTTSIFISCKLEYKSTGFFVKCIRILIIGGMFLALVAFLTVISILPLKKDNNNQIPVIEHLTTNNCIIKIL